jgi:hypothetical protein
MIYNIYIIPHFLVLIFQFSMVQSPIIPGMLLPRHLKVVASDFKRSQARWMIGISFLSWGKKQVHPGDSLLQLTKPNGHVKQQGSAW